MKTLNFILVLSVLSACGSNGGSPSTLPTKDASNEVAPESQAQVSNVSKTLMVDSLAQAQTCSKENMSQLIYSLAESGFYVCDTEGWVAIDLKGKAGSAGKDGRDGAKGEDGEDSPFLSNRWIDSVTNKEWFIGGEVVANIAYGASPVGCPSGYRLPILYSTEVDEALAHGLDNAMQALSADLDLWVYAASNPTYHSSYYDGSVGVTETKSLVCLKQ